MALSDRLIPLDESPEPDTGQACRPILMWLLGAWLAAVLLGFIAFRAPFATVGGSELSIERALFTSINAVTLTGFQQNIGQTQYRAFGQATAVLLTVAGAMLSMVGSSWAMVRILRLPYSDGQIVRAAAAALIVATGVGMALLLEPGQSLSDSASQALSAFSNSGLTQGRLGGPPDWRVHGVLMPLALAGGLGLPVLMELVGVLLGRGSSLSVHARVTLLMSAGVYLGGTILLSSIGLLNADSPRWALATASAQSINARSAGLAIEWIGPMARPGQWTVMALMAIGGGVGGCAGGVKLTTLWLLWRGTRMALTGNAPGRVFGIAMAWTGLFAAIVMAGLLSMLAAVPQWPGDRLLFLSISAASNTGLSFDPVAMDGTGLLILTAISLAGRLVPLCIIWWMAGTTRGATAAVG